MKKNIKEFVNYLKGDEESVIKSIKNLYFVDSDIPSEILDEINKLCYTYNQRKRLKGY
jgi:hypothetical protein